MKTFDKLYIYTNTKMSKTLGETLDYLTRLEELTEDISDSELELGIMPSYTALVPAAGVIHSQKLLLGAQNVCPEDSTEFTGEISAAMLKETGVRLVMLGHSERRRLFGEQDREINKKVHAVLNHDMTALLCISESREDKEAGISDEVLRIQIKRGLQSVPRGLLKNVRILYEPAWAVGVSGTPAPFEYVEERHMAVKNCMKELYGEKVGKSIPVIYGGSISAHNACGLIAQEHVDGLGIGRSAWDAKSFNRMIRQVMQFINKK